MAAKTNFRGSFTALVTPFKNGSLDEAAFRSLVNWQIAEGTHGLVPVGTTGESPTVSHDEHKRVVEWCIDEARGRVPVIAGAGCISVTANVAPRLCSEFHVAWQNADLKTALKLHDKLMPLHTNLFIESNPSPVKYALSLLGKMEETLRLPMVPVSEPTRVAVRSAMVSSLVGDIIMPIIGAITGGLDFSNYFTPLSKSVTANNLADAKKQGAVLPWGNFLTLTLNFIISP